MRFFRNISFVCTSQFFIGAFFVVVFFILFPQLAAAVVPQERRLTFEGNQSRATSTLDFGRPVGEPYIFGDMTVYWTDGATPKRQSKSLLLRVGQTGEMVVTGDNRGDGIWGRVDVYGSTWDGQKLNLNWGSSSYSGSGGGGNTSVENTTWTIRSYGESENSCKVDNPTQPLVTFNWQDPGSGTTGYRCGSTTLRQGTTTVLADNLPCTGSYIWNAPKDVLYTWDVRYKTASTTSCSTQNVCSGEGKDQICTDQQVCTTSDVTFTAGTGPFVSSGSSRTLSCNIPPVADAGAGHTALLEDLPHTHGGASTTDRDNDLASYIWELISCPLGTTCPSLSGASGSISGSGSQSVPGPTFTPAVPGLYTLLLTAIDSFNERHTSQVVEDVIAQTLTGALSATPTSGIRPLEVSFSASVSGTAPGSVNYSLWWSCDSAATTVAAASAATACGALPAAPDGTCVADTVGVKCSGISATSISTSTFPALRHTYAAANTYKPKLIVERGSAPSHNSTLDITASLPPVDLLVPSTSAPAPSTGAQLTKGHDITFTGTVKNNGTSNIASAFSNTFKIDTGNDGSFDVTLPAVSIASLNAATERTITSGTWSDIPLGTHRVVLCADEPPASPGTVDESNETNNCSPASGTGTTTGVFTVSEQTVSISFSPTPSSGLEPLTVTLPITVSGTALGPIDFYVWYDCENTTTNPGTGTITDCATLSLPAAGAGNCQTSDGGVVCLDVSTTTTLTLRKSYSASGSTDAVFKPKVIVNRGSAPNNQVVASVTVNPQTVTGTFTATPTTGNDPLSVTLTATRTGGTASGNMTYRFYWNCAVLTNACGQLATPASGACAENENGIHCIDVPELTKSVTHVYAQGSYTPHLVMLQGPHSDLVDQTASLTVARQTLSTTLSASPSTGVRPLTTTITAEISGTAPGTSNYAFWWNCTSAAATVAGAVTACGALPAPTPGTCVQDDIGAKCDGMPEISVSRSHVYATAGTSSPKVVVERGSALPAEARTTVTTSLPPVDLLIPSAPAPSAGAQLTEGYDITFTGTIRNNGSSTAASPFNNTFKIDVGNNGSFNVTLTPVSIASLIGETNQTINSGTWTNIPIGTHRVVLCADEPPASPGSVDESNETNNCSPIAGVGAANGVFTIVAQTLSATLSASPSTGVRPLTTTITAEISGTAPGTSNYAFWWNCTSAAATVAGAVTACGALPAPTPGTCVQDDIGAKCDGMPEISVSRVRTYSGNGSFTPKVVVERGSAPSAEARTTVTTNLPPVDLLISQNPVPDASQLLEGLSTTFTGTVKNNGSEAISSAFNNTFKIDVGNNGSFNDPADVTFPAISIASLGGVTERATTSPSWTMIEGTHRIVLCSDEPPPSPGAIDESNETNNCSPATGTTGVFTIVGQEIRATLGASTPQGPAPTSITITTTILPSTTAVGDINYSYWWNCTSDVTNVATAEQPSVCGDLPLPVRGQCEMNENGAKCDGMTVTSHSLQRTYQNGGTYSPKVIIERGFADTVTRRTSVVVGGQTLEISFSATPDTGTEPLLTTLSAGITSGTAPDRINYSFWWDCANTSRSVQTTEGVCGLLPQGLGEGQCAENTNGYKCNGVLDTTKGIAHTYSSGSFTPKVIIERGSATPQQAQKTVTAAGQELAVALTSSAASGVTPFTTTLSANVTGTAPNTINYSFWWHCANASTSVQTTEGICGLLPVGVASGQCAENENGYKCNGIPQTTKGVDHTYNTPGNYQPKVIVERGVATPAQDQVGPLAVTAQSLSITSFTASPASGLVPLSTTLSAVVASNAPQNLTLNYSFWWDCTDTRTIVSEVAAVCGALPTPLTGTCVENPLVGMKCDGVLTTILSATHFYSTAGTHNAKVIVERGDLAVERRTTAIANPQTLSLTLGLSPALGEAPLTTIATASVTGTAVGTTDFYFWWDCANTSTDITEVSIACGALATPFPGGCVENNDGTSVVCQGLSDTQQALVHTYVDAGTYTVKTIARQGTFAPAVEKRVALTIAEPPPQDLSVTLAARPANGVASVGSSLTARVGGDATGDINYYFWWNCDAASNDVAIVESLGGGCEALPTPPSNDCRSSDVGVACKNVAEISKTFTHTYPGPDAGKPGPNIYTPKVIVERGTRAAPATARSQVRVSRSPLVPLAIECTDGVDNNNNGLIDLADVEGCGDELDPEEDSEPLAPVGECNDLADNDNDGLTDFPDDPGCEDEFDQTEENSAPNPEPITQCNDGVDQNGDGIADDPEGCGSPLDPREDNVAVIPLVQCNNGRDDDGDGLIDFPADPGCTSRRDPIERDARQPGFKEVPATGNTPVSCDIKGDISVSNQRLFYPSTCPGYSSITIESARGERLFCSEAEARVAGWTRAPTCP